MSNDNYQNSKDKKLISKIWGKKVLLVCSGSSYVASKGHLLYLSYTF